MPDVEVIAVEGLREVQHALRALDSEAPKGLRVAHNRAAEIVVAEAKPRVPLGPGRRGHARDSIRVASTRTASRVKAGGARNPYYAWLDFGGRTGRKRSVRRPFIKEGRYIYPAFKAKRPEVQAALEDALHDVIRDAGLES